MVGCRYGWDDQMNMVSNRLTTLPMSQERVAGFEGWAGGPAKGAIRSTYRISYKYVAL